MNEVEVYGAAISLLELVESEHLRVEDLPLLDQTPAVRSALAAIEIAARAPEAIELLVDLRQRAEVAATHYGMRSA